MDLYKFETLVGSVHFMDWGLDPWWCPSIFVDLYKFETLVGSVHFVDWGLDPWWGPSNLWTCISLRPWWGLSTDGSNLLVVITQQSLNFPP